MLQRLFYYYDLSTLFQTIPGDDCWIHELIHKVKFLQWIHVPPAITNHTITVQEVRCHILMLLLMMLSSSPASQHNFLYQVPGTKGRSPHHLYTYK